MEILIIGLLAGLILSISTGLRGWLMYYEARRQAEINDQQLHASINYLQACIHKGMHNI